MQSPLPAMGRGEPDHYESPAQVAGDLNVSLLGALARTESEIVPPFSIMDLVDASEAYDPIIGRIDLLAEHMPLKLLACLGLDEDPLRFRLAANLAARLARRGRSVTIVEAELRHPALNAPRSQREGLIDMLLYGCSYAAVAAESGISGVRIITAGSHPWSGEPIHGDEWERVLGALRQHSDLTLITTTSGLPTPILSMITRRLDSIIIAYGLHAVARDAIRRSYLTLWDMDAPILGLVTEGPLTADRMVQPPAGEAAVAGQSTSEADAGPQRVAPPALDADWAEKFLTSSAADRVPGFDLEDQAEVVIRETSEVDETAASLWAAEVARLRGPGATPIGVTPFASQGKPRPPSPPEGLEAPPAGPSAESVEDVAKPVEPGEESAEAPAMGDGTGTGAAAASPSPEGEDFARSFEAAWDRLTRSAPGKPAGEPRQEDSEKEPEGVAPEAAAPTWEPEPEGVAPEAAAPTWEPEPEGVAPEAAAPTWEPEPEGVAEPEAAAPAWEPEPEGAVPEAAAPAWEPEPERVAEPEAAAPAWEPEPEGVAPEAAAPAWEPEPEGVAPEAAAPVWEPEPEGVAPEAAAPAWEPEPEAAEPEVAEPEAATPTWGEITHEIPGPAAAEIGVDSQEPEREARDMPSPPIFGDRPAASSTTLGRAPEGVGPVIEELEEELIPREEVPVERPNHTPWRILVIGGLMGVLLILGWAYKSGVIRLERRLPQPASTEAPATAPPASESGEEASPPGDAVTSAVGGDGGSSEPVSIQEPAAAAPAPAGAAEPVSRPAESRPQVAPPQTRADASVAPSVPEGAGTYGVHVSSFRTLAKAEEDLSNYQALGYQGVIVSVDIPGKGTWQRVLLGPYSSQSEASRVMETVRADQLSPAAQVQRIPR